MLTFKRFVELAESYGADLQRWPKEPRAAAEALLAVSPEARRLLIDARSVDEAIEAHDNRVTPTDEEQRAAVARIRYGVKRELASASICARSEPSVGWISRWLDVGIPGNLRWSAVGGGIAVAVVVGLLIGWTEPTPAPKALLTMLQPAPMRIFEE